MRRRSVHLSLLAVAAVANAIGAFALYANNGGAAHFLLHAVIGTTVGFSLLLVWRGLGHPPRRGELWLPYGLSAYAMLPDVIYKLGPFHRDWMDVFLGHVSADEVRTVISPVLMIVLAGLVAAYVVLGGRQRRHLATLRPTWIQRPWGRLCVRTAGSGSPLLLIHGLGGSGRYWEPLARRVASTHAVLAPDLGGFGGSDKPRVAYDLDFHLATIDAALAHASADGPLTIVGHSFGGVLAGVWASRHPERVHALALVAAPYPDGSQGMREALLHDRVTRAMAGGGVLASAVHMLMGAAAMVLGPLLRSSSVSREVMADYMRHSIPSYVGSLNSVLLGPDITPLLRPVPASILLLYGEQDREIPPATAARYQQSLDGGEVHRVKGGHQLLLETDFAPLLEWLETSSAILTAGGTAAAPP